MLSCSRPRGSRVKEGNKMKYTVRIGISQEMSFCFDCLGDAIDFASVCVENGYRATIIPLEVEDDD